MHIRLNVGFRSDLQWWDLFLAEWNVTRILACKSVTNPDATVISDASGHWGCGAFCSTGIWFHFQWPDIWNAVHITVKELLPVVVACAVWGKEWNGMKTKIKCDNAAVVAIINPGRSKEHSAIYLMRCIFFFLAQYNIFILAEHIPGKDYVAADSLSRGNLSLFHQQVPTAMPHPTPIPEELLQALIHQQPDWTSGSWRVLFISILQKV